MLLKLVSFFFICQSLTKPLTHIRSPLLYPLPLPLPPQLSIISSIYLRAEQREIKLNDSRKKCHLLYRYNIRGGGG